MRVSAILSIMFGYLASQVMRSLTACPFGFVRLQSPKAIPTLLLLVPEARLESYWFGIPRRFCKAKTAAGFSSPAHKVHRHFALRLKQKMEPEGSHFSVCAGGETWTRKPFGTRFWVAHVYHFITPAIVAVYQKRLKNQFAILLRISMIVL